MELFEKKFENFIEYCGNMKYIIYFQNPLGGGQLAEEEMLHHTEGEPD